MNLAPQQEAAQARELNPAEDALLQPTEQVLSTLRADGSRRWLTPRLAKGKLWRRRRIVAYALLALFSALPWIQIGGHPALQIDVANWQLHLFGATLLATDSLLFALSVLLIFLGVFMATAVFGRVWCGWACPQTIYMEFVFRPLERLFTGRAGIGGEPRASVDGWRKLAMYAAYLVICLHLSQTFVSYFVGAENLAEWIWQSPLQHPAAFGVVVAVTVAMMIDFAYWREQLCILGCPYGRLQSVLLDKSSCIVAYDERRGEPRGKLQREPVEAERKHGDCVDCKLCVQVCPTGIDIRDGLQLECVNCTQCIDACDHVMERIGKPKGLIRYASQEGLAGRAARLVRPRVVIYAGLMLGLIGLLSFAASRRTGTDVTVLRSLGLPFVVDDQGVVQNTMRLKLRNRTEAERVYLLELVEPQLEGLVLEPREVRVAPGELRVEPLLVRLPREHFAAGQLQARLLIEDDLGSVIERDWKLLGPGLAAVEQAPEAAYMPIPERPIFTHE
ncbi:MAG: cytochrome c oxidase accessory protein CcoG [Planctomycetota bacterium]